MANLKLTMALSHYDRHIPFFDGSVQAEGVDLTVLQVGQSHPLPHGQDRHAEALLLVTGILAPQAEKLVPR